MKKINIIFFLTFILNTWLFSQNTQVDGFVWIIQPSYDYVGSFSDNLGLIQLNGRVGYIDKSGKIVIQPRYSSTYTGNFSEGLSYFNEDGNKGYFDKTEKTVLKTKNLLSRPFSNGVAYFSSEKESGYIDKTGKIVFTINYDCPSDFSEGYASFCISGKYGYLDLFGNVVIQPQFESASKFSEGLAAIKINGKYGYIDKNGKIVIEPKFKRCKDFSEGLASVCLETSFGFIDKLGEMKIRPKYQDAWSFSEGLAPIYKDKKYGYINKSGEVIIQPQFDAAGLFSEGVAAVKQGSKWGFIKSGQGNSPQTTPSISTNANSKVFALIVGISDYPGSVDDLKFCDDDANSVYNFLKTPQGGLIPDNQLKILTDKNATYENITFWAERLFSQASENDLLLFYFSGHGTVGSFYVNGTTKGEFLPHSVLRNILATSKSKKKICVADACHSGSWEKAKKELENSGKALSSEEMVRLYYSNLTEAGNGLALFMSCQENETSIDDIELGQGLFTYYYIDGLKGSADKDRDKIITVEELYNYVKEKVGERAMTRWKNSQTPKLKGTFDHDMPIGVRN